MSSARLIAALLAVTQAGCSLALMPRPPRGGDRCTSTGNVALPILDGVVAVGAIGYGTLRTFDPLCDAAQPCKSGDRDWGALAFGMLVAAPFVVSSTLGFLWHDECQKREPKPKPKTDDDEG